MICTQIPTFNTKINVTLTSFIYDLDLVLDTTSLCYKCIKLLKIPKWRRMHTRLQELSFARLKWQILGNTDLCIYTFLLCRWESKSDSKLNLTTKWNVQFTDRVKFALVCFPVWPKELSHHTSHTTSGIKLQFHQNKWPLWSVEPC